MSAMFESIKFRINPKTGDMRLLDIKGAGEHCANIADEVCKHFGDTDPSSVEKTDEAVEEVHVEHTVG